MAEDMKAFLTRIRKARGWSLKAMADVLGYASANSLVRLEQDGTSLENLTRFVKAMHRSPAVALTPEEGQMLDSLVERRQLSDDAYRATVLLHSLLHSEPQAALSIPMIPLEGCPESTLADYFRSRQILRTVVFNCLDMPIFTGLYIAADKYGIQIAHYMMADDSASRTVERVLRLLPMTFLSSYTGYTMPLESKGPYGLLRSDVILCEWIQNGVLHCDLLSAEAPDRMRCSPLPGTLEENERLFLPDRSRFHRIDDHPMNHANGYVTYLRSCADMERDRTVMRLKPDPGMDQFPMHILLSALQDQMAAMPQVNAGIESELAEMIAVSDERYRNYCAKRQPQYHVYKKQSMWHFVRTGVLSDHMWLLRPFTPAERLEVVQSLLQSIRSNPFFHVTFLKNEDAFRDDEVVLYDGLALSIIPSQTDYHLGEGHHEALVSQEKFLHVYRSFFLNSIIGHHTLAEDRAIVELNAMAAYLADQCAG